jgi:hypothetical protein
VSHTNCQNCQNLNWEHPNSNYEKSQFNEVIFLDEDEIKQSLDCSTPIFCINGYIFKKSGSQD